MQGSRSKAAAKSRRIDSASAAGASPETPNGATTIDASRGDDGCALTEAGTSATTDTTPANLMTLRFRHAMKPPQSHNLYMHDRATVNDALSRHWPHLSERATEGAPRAEIRRAPGA